MSDLPDHFTRPITPARNIEKKFQDAADEFAAPVGKAIWAWNYCHSSFARMFALTISRQNLTIGFAVWHTLQSDSAQRELIRASAPIVFANTKPVLRHIIWALRVGDSLSTIRNDATHIATAWITDQPTPKVIPDFLSTAPKRFRRVSEYKNLQEKLDLLRGDLVALSHFNSALAAVIAFPGRYPLPRRPRIQSIQAPNLAPKKAHRGKSKAPSRPLRASRA